MGVSFLSKKITSEEEEQIFFKKRVTEQIKEFCERNAECDEEDTRTLIVMELRELSTVAPSQLLAKNYLLNESTLATFKHHATTTHDPQRELEDIFSQYGIRNALQFIEVCEKSTQPQLLSRLAETLRVSLKL